MATAKITETQINILGQDVQIKRLSREGGDDWFCAYADLQNSDALSDSFLGHPTFREGMVVGVDTAHAFNEGTTELDKFKSAIDQITYVIEKWKEATN